MSLAEDLAAAAFAATLSQTEMLQRERARLSEIRERLTAELAVDEDEATLGCRRAALARDVEALRLEAERLRVDTDRERRAFQEALDQAASALREQCRKVRSQATARLTESSLQSALEAFGSQDSEATFAEIQTELGRLVRRAKSVREDAVLHAEDVSQGLRAAGERLAHWRRLEEERSQLVSREGELLDRLSPHVRKGDHIPPIVASLREADARTLKNFRERVLEALLGDLSTRAESWLDERGIDPLNDLISSLRREPGG